MKRIVFLAGLFAAPALAQDRTVTDTFQTPPTPREQEIVTAPQVEKANQVITGKRVVSGIAVQVVKTRNPLQLINPFAPKEYGSGEDNLVADRDPVTGNHTGLKIVSVSLP